MLWACGGVGRHHVLVLKLAARRLGDMQLYCVAIPPLNKGIHDRQQHAVPGVAVVGSRVADMLTSYLALACTLDACLQTTA